MISARHFLAMLIGAVLAIGVGPACADPVKIRLGWVVVPSDFPPLLYGKEGLAKHVGVTYTVDATHFQGTPPMITALAAGELDLAPLAYSSLATAVENARMGDIRVIADNFQDGIPGYYTNEYMVLKDGPIKAVEDLKGKVLASNGLGSAVDMAMRAMMAKHHLEDKKDFTVIEAGFPNMKAMLIEHKVDLICGVRPFTADPGMREIARPLFTQKDAVGVSQMIVWTTRAEFIQKNRAALVDFMEDSLRALRWFTDPANHDEAVKIIAQYAKQPPERFQSWVFTKEDAYRDPNGMPDLKALQQNIDTERQLGFLKSDIDVAKLADLSLVGEAAKRLQ